MRSALLLSALFGAALFLVGCGNSGEESGFDNSGGPVVAGDELAGSQNETGEGAP